MKFDKNNVFTVLTADSMKIGSKGYYADTIKDLKEIVEQEYSGWYGEIEKIRNDSYSDRFDIKDNGSYALFYLVEEPKEKKYRPYKNANEMIEDFKRRYNSYSSCSEKDNPMSHPMIFIKNNKTGFYHLLTDYHPDEFYNCVWFGESRIGFESLYKNYIYLDGTPCGIEE